MTITRRHTLYGVTIHTTVLGGITAQNLNLGLQVRSEARSGEPYVRYQAVVGRAPTAGFTTEAVAAALGVCGVLGYDISDGDGLILTAQKADGGGTRAAGSVHRKYTMVAGLLVPTTLECAHGGDASISYQASVTSADGSTDPCTETDSQALPAGMTDAERFTLGAVTVGAVSLPEVKNVSINFGLNVRVEGAGGDQFPTFVWIDTVAPSITIRGLDIEWLKSSNIPRAGKAATHANTTIYLRKRALGGSFTADATEEHIKISACGLAWVDDPFSDDGEGAEASVTIQPKYDGTNTPILIDSTSALPA